MVFVDTHCHLHYSPENLDASIANAKQAGVAYMVCVSTNMDDDAKMDHIITHDGIYKSIGVHPLSVDKYRMDQIESYLRQAGSHKLVAVGETGLDNFRNPLTPAQVPAFEVHLKIAEERNLPIIMHTRGDVEEVAMEVLRQTRATGIAHCFGGSMRFAEFLIAHGWYISFAGNLTYKKSADLHEVAMNIPLESILIETDAPFLSPEPLRGKQNEPANVVYVAKKLAELRKTSLEEVMEYTTRNAMKIFDLN